MRRGDCVEVMQSMPDASVDAIVTDPPYGLGFMGKKWDDLPPGDDFAREAFRVCKPGAYVVAFGGTRTVHRLTVALEDAGFEIRDTLHWCYWSGFPKSLDVSKAMDRKKYDREQIEKVVRWFEAARARAGVSRSEVERRFGTINIGQALFTLTPGSSPRVPTLEQVPVLLDLFGLDLCDVDEDIRRLIWDLNAPKGQPGPNWSRRDVVGQYKGHQGGFCGERLGNGDGNITTPATEAARQWQGWGTALKPAIEPAIMARKPLTGTVANNVLEWGTGAINIDASRIAYGDPAWPGPQAMRDPNRFTGTDGGSFVASPSKYPSIVGHDLGRWPGNLYYCPKASTAEREAGCSDLRQQAAGELTGGREEGSAGLDSPRAGAGRMSAGRGNSHPTVKPIRLMRWIVRLVTPPGGVVLEPFAGSGTTLLAAELADIDARCIAIEREAQYIDIIRARFGARSVLRRMLTRSVAPAEAAALISQGDLFDEVGT